MKINAGATLLLLLFTLIISNSAYALDCQAQGLHAYNGIGGSFNVYVDLDPSVQIGQTITVSLGDYIKCSSLFSQTAGLNARDEVVIQSGNISSLLNYISGSISYYGNQYDLPLTSATSSFVSDQITPSPWQTVLYFKVNGSGASGVVVSAGQLLATLTMMTQTFTDQNIGGPTIGPPITWNIYSNNAVILPRSGCDVSSNNMTITLPDYPGTAAIPLSVHCAQNVNVSYYLTGSTIDSANTLFSNAASTSPAAGIGVQLSNRNGVIATNNSISLGSVGASPVDLGMTASYARTSGQVIAGNVQSLIGVMFVYQ